MRITLLLLLFLFQIPLKAQESKVVVITIDGLRWKEVFRGADSYLINNDHFTSSKGQYIDQFYRKDSLERRQILMPFVWNTISKDGVILGNRDEKNFVNLVNKRLWSYPGYNEIITGAADDARIKNNDDIENPNISIFEYVNQQKGYGNKVAVLGSWKMFTYIFNQRRSKLPINAGYQNSFNPNKTEKELLIEKIQNQTYQHWKNTRFDIFTHEFALETLKNQKPKLLFIGYGEPDDFGHDKDYDQYLTSIHKNDKMIEEVWNYLQSDPYYKNQTTLIITTDHGRGNFYEWVDHSPSVKGSDEGFIMMMGPDLHQKDFTKNQYYNNQIAQTIADLLQVNWNNKKAGKSLLK